MSTDTTVDTVDTVDTRDTRDTRDTQNGSVVEAEEKEKKPARGRKTAAKKDSAPAEPEVSFDLVPLSEPRGLELDEDPVHNPVPSIKPEDYVDEAFGPNRADFERARATADLILFDPEALAALPEDQRGAAVVVDLSSIEGMAAVKEQQEKFRQLRLANDRTHARYKEPFLRIGKRIDATRNALKEKIAEYEERFGQAVAAEEARREAERDKLVQIEQARVAGLRARVEGIRATMLEAYGMPAGAVRALIAEIEAIAIDDSFAEYAELATQARTDALRALGSALAAAERTEAQLAELSRYRDQFGPIAAPRGEPDEQPAGTPLTTTPGMAAPLDDAVINRALAIGLFMVYRCITGQSRDTIGATREARRLLLRAGYTAEQLGLEVAA